MHSLVSALTLLFFFFNDTATTEIYTLSLHDALPISTTAGPRSPGGSPPGARRRASTPQDSPGSRQWQAARRATRRTARRGCEAAEPVARFPGARAATRRGGRVRGPVPERPARRGRDDLPPPRPR